MLESIFNNQYHKLIAFLERWLATRFWYLKVTFISTLLIFIFSFPNYDLISSSETISSLHLAIEKQIASPFTPQVYPIASHQAKIGLRITVPLIAHCLNIGVLGCLAIQHLLGFIFLNLSSVLIHSVTKDKIIAAFFTLSLSCCYVAKAFFLDTGGVFDGYAFLFILICMLPNTPKSVIFICLLASHFIDERAIIATGFVFLWWIVQDNAIETNPFKWLLVSPKAFIVLISMLATLLIRYYLANEFGLKTPTGNEAAAGLGIIRQNWPLLPLGIFSSIEFFWVVILASFLLIIQKKYVVFGSLFICVILSTQMVSLMVYDLTRSSAYVFPSLTIACVLISKTENVYFLRKTAFLLLICMFLFPSQYVETYSGCTWESPIVPKILKYFL